MKDHNDTVIGIRQKGTSSWGYQDSSGKLAFGPLSARTLFFEKGQDTGAISSYMSKAREQGTTVEQVSVRRSLEVLQDETV
jgi:hypothetical protein